MPKGHPLTQAKSPIDIMALAAHPLITYVFSSKGESSFKRAFAEHGLEPQVVFTARDADIIKTYVRMGMGVGVVASMAYECADEKDLVALEAVGLFPRVTTWLGFRRDSVLRGYMADFITLFAPQLQTYFAAMPVKSLAAMAVLSIYVLTLLSHGDDFFREPLLRESEAMKAHAR